ncbi:hypothetical protein ACFLQN_01920 [Candidatus Aenigmatarchaeota archaeon]
MFGKGQDDPKMTVVRPKGRDAIIIYDIEGHVTAVSASGVDAYIGQLTRMLPPTPDEIPDERTYVIADLTRGCAIEQIYDVIVNGRGLLVLPRPKADALRDHLRRAADAKGDYSKTF